MKTEEGYVHTRDLQSIQVPVDTFMDECFLRELSSFLVQIR